MPIRRAAATPPQDKGPSVAPEEEPSEDSPTVVEEEEEEEEEAVSDSPVPAEEDGEVAASADTNGEGGAAKDGGGEVKTAEDTENEGHAMPTVANGETVKCRDCAEGQCATHCFVLLIRMKDGVKLGKTKVKKLKRTIPPWASISANKKIPVAAGFSRPQPKVEEVLLEAVMSGSDHSGMSYMSILKYMMKKYPSLELEKRKYLIKKALKKHLEKGTIKQLKGKGLAGSFAARKQPTPKASAKKSSLPVGMKSETLGDALPLIITRLCEPKEASYIFIKKYLEQHFPHLHNRPDMLKTALVRAVTKGHLERITGKGASGTFQLKRVGDKVLLSGGPLEDAISTAIIAMNEPKTCSTNKLLNYLCQAHQDSSESRIVALLRKTLTKCKMLGWMDQITGSGLNGTYRLAFPYYPSPAVLFPDRVIAPPKKKTPQRRTADTSDEESEEEPEEEESDDEPPPPRRKPAKRPAPKARLPPSKKPRSTSQSKARGKRPAPAKKPAAPAKKKPTPAPAKKPTAASKKAAATAAKAAPPAKATAPAKASPVKRAAPAKRPKTPAVKKLGARSAKAATPQKSSAKKAPAKKEVKAKPTARKSLRGKK